MDLGISGRSWIARGLVVLMLWGSVPQLAHAQPRLSRAERQALYEAIPEVFRSGLTVLQAEALVARVAAAARNDSLRGRLAAWRRNQNVRQVPSTAAAYRVEPAPTEVDELPLTSRAARRAIFGEFGAWLYAHPDFESLWRKRMGHLSETLLPQINPTARSPVTRYLEFYSLFSALASASMGFQLVLRSEYPWKAPLAGILLFAYNAEVVSTVIGRSRGRGWIETRNFQRTPLGRWLEAEFEANGIVNSPHELARRALTAPRPGHVVTAYEQLEVALSSKVFVALVAVLTLARTAGEVVTSSIPRPARAGAPETLPPPQPVEALTILVDDPPASVVAPPEEMGGAVVRIDVAAALAPDVSADLPREVEAFALDILEDPEVGDRVVARVQQATCTVVGIESETKKLIP